MCFCLARVIVIGTRDYLNDNFIAFFIRLLDYFCCSIN